MTAPAATLDYRGKLVHRFRTAGEAGADGVFPRHVGGLQLSRDRFLLLLTSGGWRGSDDNRGTLYQIRAGGYDGELLCEGVLRATTDDWDARSDGRVYSRQTIGPLGFGVPAGALMEGQVPAHAGLFTFMWTWTRTGPVSAEGLWEPCPMRLRDGDWAISARVRPAFRRPEGGMAWLRAADPLSDLPQPVYVDVPAPGLQTAFRCADGVIRIYGNDSRVRPGWPGMRNPLYQWDVDTECGFAAGEPQVVFDAVDWKMPIRDEAKAVVDQAKVLSHAGGDRQTVVHRLRTFALADPAHAGVAVNAAERQAHGVYYSDLVFDRAHPGEWDFPANIGA